MPISYRYDEEKNILYGKIYDSIALEDIIQLLEKITSSKNYPPSVPALWDLRECNLLHIDSEFLSRYLELLKRYPRRGKAKIAFIVNNNYAFGMGRMCEFLAQAQKISQSIMVHRDFTAGEEWLLSESELDFNK